MSDDFVVNDSGEREDYASGMRRDTEEGKTDFTLALDGPMFERYATHLTKGAAKYGRRNWQLAESTEEYERFKRSAFRHFVQWLRGDRDEDHAAAVWFNINAAEYVRDRLHSATPATSGLLASTIEHYFPINADVWSEPWLTQGAAEKALFEEAPTSWRHASPMAEAAYEAMEELQQP